MQDVRSKSGSVASFCGCVCGAWVWRRGHAVGLDYRQAEAADSAPPLRRGSAARSYPPDVFIRSPRLQAAAGRRWRNLPAACPSAHSAGGVCRAGAGPRSSSSKRTSLAGQGGRCRACRPSGVSALGCFAAGGSVFRSPRNTNARGGRIARATGLADGPDGAASRRRRAPSRGVVVVFPFYRKPCIRRRVRGAWRPGRFGMTGACQPRPAARWPHRLFALQAFVHGPTDEA